MPATVAIVLPLLHIGGRGVLVLTRKMLQSSYFRSRYAFK
jgi:hypothetical protein